jgi:glycosyltransferase involved in cell wall biosynthesis
LRIAIDASRTTAQRITGTEHYAIRLIRALIGLNSEHQLILYFRDRPSPDLFPPHERVTQRVIPFPRAWTHARFAAALWREHPDVTFVPAHTLPVYFPGRAVVTVHDLGFRYFPEAHPTLHRLYLDWTTRYSAERANVVLADSRATADDLTLFFNIARDKIQVVYPGVETPHQRDMKAVREKYHLPERYFLFLGTLQPRKNIAVIVQSYLRWRAAHPDDSVRLVLAGGKGWLYDDKWAEGLPGVQMTGFVDEADKGALYAGALALVFPSLYEGFGFPVIEAMRCGTPVITSNTSSLPELAGHAGLLVNPLDVGEIAEAMTKIAVDHDLRQRLIERGRQQAAQFTWERAAEQAMSAFESAVK